MVTGLNILFYIVTVSVFFYRTKRHVRVRVRTPSPVAFLCRVSFGISSG